MVYSSFSFQMSKIIRIAIRPWPYHLGIAISADVDLVKAIRDYLDLKTTRMAVKALPDSTDRESNGVR